MVWLKTANSALHLFHAASVQKIGSPVQFHHLIWNNQKDISMIILFGNGESNIG